MTAPRFYAARIPAQALLRRMWAEADESNPLRLVEQAIDFALRQYDLELERVPVILQNTSLAGRFVRTQRLVQLSNSFSPRSQRFTTAHELGHFFLHPNEDHFCDREPQHGVPRPYFEKEADCFAAELLMPAKLVISEFLGRFQNRIAGCHTDQLVWFEIASYKRIEPTQLISHFARVPPLVRAREIASMSAFAGNLFTPLNDIFAVSKDAMGIRLLDLGLVL